MMKSAKNRIAERRKSLGITQQQLADAVGAHWITISKLERGKIKLTTEWLDKLANPLSVTARDLLPDTFVGVGFAEPENRFSSPMASRRKNSPQHAVSLTIVGSDFEPLLRAGDKVQLLPLRNLSSKDRKRVEGRLAFEGASIRSLFGLLYMGKRPDTYDLFWVGARVAEGVKASKIYLVERISFRLG